MIILTEILLIFTFLTVLLSFYFVIPEICGSYSSKHFPEALVQRCSVKKILKTLLKFKAKLQCLRHVEQIQFNPKNIEKETFFYCYVIRSFPPFWLNVFLKTLSLLAKHLALYESWFVWEEDQFRSSVFEALPRTGFFTACMGAYSSVVQLDSAIQFGNVPDPFKGIRVPLALFQIGSLVRQCPSIHTRDKSVSM